MQIIRWKWQNKEYNLHMLETKNDVMVSNATKSWDGKS